MGVLYVCVFSSHPFWTSSSLDVPAGVTQEEGHTGFLIHLLSAVHALIFLARRIQPFLSLVDREVEFCVLTNDFNRSPPVGHFYFGFLVFSEKNPVCRDRTHVPTCQKVTRCRLSYRGILYFLFFIFCEEKSQLPGFELTSQRVGRFRGYQLNHPGDRTMNQWRKCLKKNNAAPPLRCLTTSTQVNT